MKLSKEIIISVVVILVVIGLYMYYRKRKSNYVPYLMFVDYLNICLLDPRGVPIYNTRTFVYIDGCKQDVLSDDSGCIKIHKKYTGKMADIKAVIYDTVGTNPHKVTKYGVILMDDMRVQLT